MQDLLFSYAGQALYTVGCLLIGWLWRSLQTSRRDYGAIREGVCALLRDRLMQRIEKCIHNGYCSKEMREELTHMGGIYGALGGNGVIPPLMKKVMALPLEPPKRGTP